MFAKKLHWFSVAAIMMLMLPAFPSAPVTAQAGSRFFTETQKTVRGAFLAYWTNNGGLPQQGFPISEEMQEVSDTDGKTYTVQYFERAVFELHPELPAPNNVLLSLLGVFLYNQKYGNNAQGQVANAQGRLFPETGKRVGGIFLDYWQRNGGLAQQGFPISEEFQEVSDLDGKTYRVQYFQRAVFEFHPENAPPYNVLLSQLGKFRYQQKYASGGPRPPGPPQPPAPGQPTATPRPPAPPPAGNRPTPCGNLPGNVNGVQDRDTIFAGESMVVLGVSRFTPGEQVSFWFTVPQGGVLGTARPLDIGVNGDGSLGPFEIPTSAEFASFPGRWALTFQGAFSRTQSVFYFCVQP